MTFPAIVRKIKQTDTDSAINETMLRSLAKSGLIPTGKRGNRTVVDYETVIRILRKLLELDGITDIPHIRTVRTAIAQARHAQPEIGIGEEHIRQCISEGVIPVIAVGNRNYIASEMFDVPYIERFEAKHIPPDSTATVIRKDVIGQMNNIIAAGVAVPQVRRVKKTA